MNEDEARELALVLMTDFEELLEEHDVTVPSADRDGKPEEARLHGSEYYALEDAVTEVLKKHAGRRIGLEDARRLSFLILEEIEETLHEAGCSLPPELRKGPYGYPRLGEQEWDRLRETILGALTGHGCCPKHACKMPAGHRPPAVMRGDAAATRRHRHRRAPTR